MPLLAVIKVTEEQWYTDNRDGALGGARLTNWYAPLPVFFEGHESTPRADISTRQLSDGDGWAWDFGDGSDVFYGFEAAHVYETPGVYTCTLTVTDHLGNTDQDTIEITAIAPDGLVYYVDSSLGSDASTGLAVGAGAWKTADKALAGLKNNFYNPGDQVLFKRGQTFDMTSGLVEVAHWKTSSGWMFGTYGAGAKPILKLIATSNSNNIIYVTGVGMAHVTFEDLVFDCKTAGGARCDLFLHLAEVYDLLFLRCDIKNMNQGIILSGGTADRRQSGIFIIDSTMDDSKVVEFFATSARIALLGNTFQNSGNHINYLPYVDKGVIANNTFQYAAFGRAALRIDGQAAAYPTNNVQVSYNTLNGWVDPIDGFPTTGWNNPASPNYDPDHSHNGGGTRYNFYLVYLAPQAPEEQVMQYVTFEHNICTDCERFMLLGNYESLTINDNEFYSLTDASPDGYRFNIGIGGLYPGFEYKPLKDILFTQNLIHTNENRGGTYFAGVFAVFSYAGPNYPPNVHSNIKITNNTVTMDGAAGVLDRFLYFDSEGCNKINEIHTSGNTITASSYNKFVQVGGSWTGGGTLYTKAEWDAGICEETGFKSWFMDAATIGVGGTNVL